MKPTVYVETTIVSYLTARLSRDLVTAAHQQITHEWWANRRAEFELFVSRFVVQEASMGDAAMVQRRLEELQAIPHLAVNQDAENLAQKLVVDGQLPKKAAVDALHIAVATVHGMDYLLTWNCKHIANAKLQSKVAARANASKFLGKLKHSANRAIRLILKTKEILTLSLNRLNHKNKNLYFARDLDALALYFGVF